MAQVTIRINGYSYTLGCADGQESHLEAMAAEIERRVERLKTASGPAGESRLLVLSALMLADELHDRKRDLEEVRRQFDEVRKQVARLESSPVSEDPKLGRRLGKLARRAEEIAAGLEHP